MSRACTACAGVGLVACGASGCLYDGSRVSLERPTGRKAPRKPGMPETRRLVAASEESNRIGEFLDWLRYDLGITLCVLDERTDRFEPARGSGLYRDTEHLLAQFYGIDLGRVERERRRLLAYLRTKGSA